MPDYLPYRVEVVTPEGPAFEGDAQIVVVPGSAGELGVLANHAPLVSSLDPGCTRLTDAEGNRHAWATSHGFIAVRKNEAMVLVGEAVARDQIDTAVARERLDRARSELERAEQGEGDVYAAQREAKFAEALLNVAEG